jgi:hypothetical protein
MGRTGRTAPNAAVDRDFARRVTPRLDFATADWQRNEHGVDMLMLSRDAANGAVTFALRTPADFRYPERQHFYDSEEELFQFQGDFRHDRIHPYRAGDYVYRPVGTVYGDDEGSDGGGIIIASLAREMRRHHFDDHPRPWRGHYLVDERWNPRPERPFVLNTAEARWGPCPLGPGVQVCALRGNPGLHRSDDAVFEHSPWAADFAAMLRVPVGYDGDWPCWPGFVAESLVISGLAVVGSERWYRGCYGFGALTGPSVVTERVEVYVRGFRTD